MDAFLPYMAMVSTPLHQPRLWLWVWLFLFVGSFVPRLQLWNRLWLCSMKEREQGGASVSCEGRRRKIDTVFYLVVEAGDSYY